MFQERFFFFLINGNNPTHAFYKLLAWIQGHFESPMNLAQHMFLGCGMTLLVPSQAQK